MRVDYSARSGGFIRTFLDFLTRRNVVCSHKNRLIETILIITHNIPFQYKIEHSPKLTQICSYKIFFLGTQERVRNSRGKLAIEVLLYLRLNLIMGHFRLDRHPIAKFMEMCQFISFLPGVI